MKKQSILSTLMLLAAIMLAGCYDMGYLEKPVNMDPKLEAAMDSAVHQLVGGWTQVSPGSRTPISGGYGYYLIFDNDTMVTVRQNKSGLNNKNKYKLGYDWKYRGTQVLEGHIFFPTNSDFIEPFWCRIECDNTKMLLSPDYQNTTYYVEDPTMYFVKQ